MPSRCLATMKQQANIPFLLLLRTYSTYENILSFYFHNNSVSLYPQKLSNRWYSLLWRK